MDDWGKLLGDTAAVTALLDRLLHHAHVLKCGPRGWRTKLHGDLPPGESVRYTLMRVAKRWAAPGAGPTLVSGERRVSLIDLEP